MSSIAPEIRVFCLVLFIGYLDMCNSMCWHDELWMENKHSLYIMMFIYEYWIRNCGVVFDSRSIVREMCE